MDLNRKPNQGGASMASSSGSGPDPNANSDWRSQLPPDTRRRTLIQIIDTLKRHIPVPVPEGLSELQKIAIWFEEKIYSSATSEPDYVQKVSLEMLSMETKMQPGMNSPLSNSLGRAMTAQQPGPNPDQSLAMMQAMNQPAARQQQQPSLQGSSDIPTAVPGGPSGATIPPMSGPSMSNSNPMSVPGGPTGSLPTDMYLNTQRRQPPQQLISQNQMLYQQQLAMCQKQQQNPLQTSSALAGGSGMMSASPIGGMQLIQMNSVQQQLVGQGGFFQQKPLVWQQQQQPQPIMQNPAMQQTNTVTSLQQQQLQMQKNQMQHSQMQQNQLLLNQMQQSQMLNRQQNQLLERGGSGNMNSMQRQMQMQREAGLLQQQQQPQQQQHLLSQFQSQQLQLPLLQQQLQLQQQQPSMMQQREMQGSSVLLQMQNSNAIDPQRQQQQQFIPQQPQPLQQQRVLQDVASSSASMDSTAQTGHPGDFQEEMYQRIKYLKDTYFNDLREIHQKLSMKLNQVDSIVSPNARGGEQIERMKNFKTVLERMMAVLQLGKHDIHIGLKDKLSLYEKQILNILQNNKKAPQQQPQGGGPDQQYFPPPQQSQPVLQSQQSPQQHQPQRVLQYVASSSQAGHPGDFQEEIYQRIKYLKDTYFNDLREIYQKLLMKLNHVDSIVPPNARGGEQIERMKNFKTVLERMMAVLQLGKHNVHIGLKDKLSLYEKQILNILQNNKKAPQQQHQAEPARRVKPRICQVCDTCAHKRRDQ